MVLVRKHYFRVHCEAVAREARKRSRSLNLKRRLRLSHLFPSNLTNILSGENDVPHLHVHQATHDEAYLRAEDGIGGALAGGLVALGLALPSESRQSNDIDQQNDFPRVASPERLSADGHHDGDGHGVMADAHSFTSSPRSGLMELTTSPEVRFADLASPTAKSHRSIRYRNGQSYFPVWFLVFLNDPLGIVSLQGERSREKRQSSFHPASMKTPKSSATGLRIRT